MRKARLTRRLADANRLLERAETMAEAQSREIRRLRLACESLPQAVIVCDETRRAIVWNRAGFADERWAPLVEATIDELLQQCTGMTPVARELELHGPPARALVVTATPLREAGEWLGVVVSVDDLSERRQLEHVRRDFIANVSHELRTPIGALALLADALGGETDPDVVARLADRMSAEAERAGRMIEDLLDLSRIEAGGVAEGAPVSIAAVIKTAAERVRPIAELKGVDILTSFRPSADPKVPGDKAQLTSAVSNLLDNAVKYSDPGSSVKVKARSRDDGWVEVSVRDRGIGIPGKDLERIFERFYRVDRARSRETGGTGLGLSIVRHVADNHGGEVTVDSEEGAGSTFVLRLPSGGT